MDKHQRALAAQASLYVVKLALEEMHAKLVASVIDVATSPEEVISARAAHKGAEALLRQLRVWALEPEREAAAERYAAERREEQG